MQIALLTLKYLQYTHSTVVLIGEMQKCDLFKAEVMPLFEGNFYE